MLKLQASLTILLSTLTVIQHSKCSTSEVAEKEVFEEIVKEFFEVVDKQVNETVDKDFNKTVDKVVHCPFRPHNESMERMLKRKLFKSYDSSSRPVIVDEFPVEVQVGLSLFHLLDTNEKQQTIKAIYSLRFSWFDAYLPWNASEYCGLGSISVPSNQIWRPDMVILNTAQDEFKDYMETYALVSSNGRILWMTPFSTATTCNIDVRYYPFDEQVCELIFMSWTFSGKQLNLTFNPAQENAIYYNPDNQEWEVTNIDVIRHEKIYACCPKDPYPDITFKMRMHRRSLFYVLNLVLPSIIIYLLAVVGFFLPNTDKVTMETTVLLTLVVFLLMVSDTMPPTPDSVPVLSLLFVLILTLVSVAIFMAVIVTNLSTRPRFRPIPRYGRLLIRLMFYRYTNEPAIRAVLKGETNKDNGHSIRLSEIADLKGEANGNGNGNGQPVSHRNRCESSSTTMSDWGLFAEALDWLCFYIFIGLSVGMVVLFFFLMLPAFRDVHERDVKL